MKACLCVRGNDINAQLQVENSIFPRFGRSRGSEKLTSIAKSNLQKTKNTIVTVTGKDGASVSGCNGKESEAVIVDQDTNKNSILVKTTTTAINMNDFDNKENNTNGHSTSSSDMAAPKVQRTSTVLHTDL